ncbi:MAG: sigma-E processing peptidase SpoIIGA, partial [Clostridia bacterium]
LVFYIVSFAFAGAAVMFSERLNINDGLNGLAVSGGVLVAFGAIRYLAKALYQRKNEKNFIYSVEIATKKGVHRCNGYYDSGNKLSQASQPVVVISRTLSEQLALPYEGEIAVNTVGGVKVLSLVNITFKIYYAGGVNKIYNTKAAVTDNIRSNAYDIILHREMGGGNETTYRKNQGNNQKIPNSF